MQNLHWKKGSLIKITKYNKLKLNWDLDLILNRIYKMLNIKKLNHLQIIFIKQIKDLKVYLILIKPIFIKLIKLKTILNKN